MTIFYFTATGNSLWTAKQFDGATLISIPQVVDEPTCDCTDDVIGIVFPIYGFTMPNIVRRFLKKARLTADYTFVIGTYGKMYGSFCGDLQKFAHKRGLKIDYINTLLMLDNALIGFEMEEERRILPGKKVEEHLAEIQHDIESRRHFCREMLPYKRLRNFIVRTLDPIMMMPSMGKRMLSVDEKCNQCGTCARLCPVGNITVTDPNRDSNRITFGNFCEMCGGCCHNCPQNAIHMRGEKSAARWRHPEVSLKEIIAANGRIRIEVL